MEWLCQVCPPCSRVRGHASFLLAFWGLHRRGQTHDKKTCWFPHHVVCQAASGRLVVIPETVADHDSTGTRKKAPATSNPSWSPKIPWKRLALPQQGPYGGRGRMAVGGWSGVGVWYAVNKLTRKPRSLQKSCTKLMNSCSSSVHPISVCCQSMQALCQGSGTQSTDFSILREAELQRPPWV